MAGGSQQRNNQIPRRGGLPRAMNQHDGRLFCHNVPNTSKRAPCRLRPVALEPSCESGSKVTKLHTGVELTGTDRLIVALDVATVDEALRVVEQLDNVSFFKIGLQLFLTGGLPLLLETLSKTKRVFVDL